MISARIGADIIVRFSRALTTLSAYATRHSLHARVNWPRVHHEIAYARAAIRRARKRDRRAMIDRVARKIAAECIRWIEEDRK